MPNFTLLTRTVLPFFASLFILTSCQESATTTENKAVQPANGFWLMVAKTDQTNFPFHFSYNNDEAVFMNGKERISASVSHPSADSVVFDMPYFPSQFFFSVIDQHNLEGMLHLSPQKDPIKVSAQFISQDTDIPAQNEKPYTKYEVTFSPNTKDSYPALGLFQHQDNYAYGTFLTETGDYRYLDGLWNEDKMTLTCFDGAHLFRFDCNISGDSLTQGMFYSGSKWQEPWHAIANDQAMLTDPFSLTYMLPGEDEVSISVLNEQEEEVLLDKTIFEGKVSLLQIFGSWCPNCLDENIFYKSLYDKYHKDGLEILPVAFERTDDAPAGIAAARKHLDHAGIAYPLYFGGNNNKATTSERFPMLNKIISYPTTIFIGKDGKVKHIHTGFSGPGTGKYYTEYTQKTEDLIQQMLAE